MDVKKLVEAIAPPQDCATCEHLNLDQTMPLTDPPIPIAYCPLATAYEDESYDADTTHEEVEKYKECADFWAHAINRCPLYSRDMTKDELKARIKELEQEKGDMCHDCEQPCEDYQPEPPDHSWRD